ncbi:MAG TPA: MBL fold metallo-hydrolase [Puia sp.]|nr:MBL fold metallo-hydrolase [Puia sp.]
MKSSILSILSFLVLQTAFAQRATPDVVPASGGSITIQPIVHASLVLEWKNLTIYIDPSGGAANYTGIKPPDLIFITDIHGDHFDLNTLSAVRTSSTAIIVPKAVADKMPDSLKSRIVILNNGDKSSQSGITVTALPMYNLPESPTAMHTKGRGNGYVLGIGGKNLYISGDTQGIPEMRALKNIDIAFVCMNLPYTMDVNEAADAVLAFKPKTVYPYHYRGQGGLSDVNAFKAKVEAGNKDIKVVLKNWYPTKG